MRHFDTSSLVFIKEIMIINKECVIKFMFLALKKLITL